ncbi:globin domain-containing protein [Cognatishimia sp.]|uniref:globin domain-containing protein n=1 Tax=Cognatishimia sp. TaxID=2211648 RepID=UPI003516A5AE
MADLTKDEVHLIQASYRSIKLQQGYLAEAFYRTLFRNTPEARGLFPDDMSEQLENFSDMLDFLVNNLSTPWLFTGKIKRLGKRHATYDALPEHYDLVGAALIEAIEDMTPRTLTDAEVAAWQKAYRGIAAMMKEAAYTDAA